MTLNQSILLHGVIIVKKVVKVATLRNEHAIYFAIFTYAMKELFLIDSNVWHTVAMPSKEQSRNQHITPEHQELLLNSLDWTATTTPENSKNYVAWAFCLHLKQQCDRAKYWQCVGQI